MYIWYSSSVFYCCSAIFCTHKAENILHSKLSPYYPSCECSPGPGGCVWGLTFTHLFRYCISLLAFIKKKEREKKKKNHKRGDVASIWHRWKEVTLDHCAFSSQNGKRGVGMWCKGPFDSQSRCCRAHIDLILLSQIATLHPAAPLLLLQPPPSVASGENQKKLFICRWLRAFALHLYAMCPPSSLDNSRLPVFRGHVLLWDNSVNQCRCFHRFNFQGCIFKPRAASELDCELNKWVSGFFNGYVLLPSRARDETRACARAAARWRIDSLLEKYLRETGSTQ